MNNSTPIVVEHTFHAPVEKVWNAISDNDLMKQWYFELKDFKPEVGFEFQFEGGNEDRMYTHLCKVIEVAPRQKLIYTWRYQGYPGTSLVTWQLFDEGNTTRLKLTHEGLETFPASNPDFKKANFVEGWTAILTSSLKMLLERTPGK